MEEQDRLHELEGVTSLVEDILPYPKGVTEYLDVPPIAYSKWPLRHFVQAAFDGDLPMLEKMLDREDPVNGYHHDINAHSGDLNALHAASMNGQSEAVQMLLSARADPHVKTSMPHGKDPADGDTARSISEEWGWNDITEILRIAENTTPKGIYLRYGTGNNSKLWPMDNPEGLDPEQEKRAKQLFKGMKPPLPNKEDRKWYGDRVFGLTHGYDENGKVIKNGGRRKRPKKTKLGNEMQAATPEVPPTTIGLLFPGPGSQHANMLSGASKLPNVPKMLAIAETFLGYDIVDACSSLVKLEDITVALPAIYIASLAAVEKLRLERPEAVERPGAVAGLSVGEVAALTVAGVWDFQTGLEFVKTCAVAIVAASKETPQVMLSVAGLDIDQTRKICEQVSASMDLMCQVNQELFKSGCTCAGAPQAMQSVEALVLQAGALQSKLLEGSPAYHTPWMESARQQAHHFVSSKLSEMKPPRCDIYLNATGKVLKKGTDPASISPLVCDMLTKVVLWEPCIQNMLVDGITAFYEVGPLKQLKAMMKRIDQGAWAATQNINLTPES